VNEGRDDSEDYQDVNKSSCNVEGKPPEQPYYEENESQYEKHYRPCQFLRDDGAPSIEREPNSPIAAHYRRCSNASAGFIFQSSARGESQPPDFTEL
jgi:hypothetical protein